MAWVWPSTQKPVKKLMPSTCIPLSATFMWSEFAGNSARA
jgi:hypothetical protein